MALQLPRLRALLGWVVLLLGCHAPAPARPTLTLKYQPFGGDPAAFATLLASFQKAHPEVELRAELLPNDSGVAHQFFVTALEGRTAAFDVFVVDVVWVAELARAGWIAPLDPEVNVERLRAEFLPAAAESVVIQDRPYAVPWYADTGVLFYRKDWVMTPPRTFRELEASVRHVQAEHPEARDGYLWQGRQSEGLVCNVYEAIWAHGGQTGSADRPSVDTTEARAALAQLRRFLTSGISPPSVLSASEEDNRRAFQSGRAVFMRNWPYVLEESEREGSALRGKVGVAALPSVQGTPGPGALGGYELALNAQSSPEKRAWALALIRHLTSEHAVQVLARHYGRSPARLKAYSDPELQQARPELRVLEPLLMNARPRPVTPYYGMLADTLQSAFSAAVSGVAAPAEALSEAQARADFLTEHAR